MITQIFYAILSGLLPALLWLWFWLREDNLHPEPRERVMKTFIAGMCVVLFVLPVQVFFSNTVDHESGKYLMWAFTEEAFKLIAAWIFAISTDVMDEPIDAVIYMITVALGFAAIENTLFILKPIFEGDIIRSIVTTNLRFIGATLLHVVSSASVGLCIAMAYYHSRETRRIALVTGLILATALHTAFNLFIIKTSTNDTLRIFSAVWVAVVILLFLFEKVKTISPNHV